MKIDLTKAELRGARWALGNFAQAGDYHDTEDDKRLYSAICRAFDKIIKALRRAEGHQ